MISAPGSATVARSLSHLRASNSQLLCGSYEVRLRGGVTVEDREQNVSDAKPFGVLSDDHCRFRRRVEIAKDAGGKLDLATKLRDSLQGCVVRPRVLRPLQNGLNTPREPRMGG
ncbi:MAG: hypothetical protein M3Q08_03990 [Pseudomonadota bacterium]|nr:hypothetical protein [Pseudomonadota bacterium]